MLHSFLSRTSVDLKEEINCHLGCSSTHARNWEQTSSAPPAPNNLLLYSSCNQANFKDTTVTPTFWLPTPAPVRWSLRFWNQGQVLSTPNAHDWCTAAPKILQVVKLSNSEIILLQVRILQVKKSSKWDAPSCQNTPAPKILKVGTLQHFEV
jgi:hypothetical protein